MASSRRLADVPGQPRADRWEAAPDEDLYRASHPLDVQESYQPGDPYAVDSGPAQVPRARPRSYSPHEGAYSDVRAQEYVAEAPPPVNAAYYSPPSRAQYPTYESETKPGPLSMQDRYILLMRTIELHDDAWRLASIRANEEKDRLEAYLIPRNKRLELKQAIHRNQFMVITIDRLGNTTIKQPRREGLLRRIWRWLFGGD
ncbi:MAG: hypothetical protein Kow00106_17520 [Anaerolineae bacterium]